MFGAAGGAALLSVGLIALMVTASGAIKERQAAVDSARAELAALPRAPNAAENAADDAALAAELSTRSTALSTALAGRVAWDSVLRQVSQVLPEDVWLTSLTSTSPAPSETDPTAVSATGVVLAGSTYAQSGVARLLSRLSVAPTLANVRLQSSTTTQSGSSTLVLFTIMADVKAAGDAS